MCQLTITTKEVATIVINGTTYDSDTLTKEACGKILMAQVFDKRINELKNDQVMAQIALNTVVLELEAMTAGKMTTVQPVQKIISEPVAEKSAPEAKSSTAKNKTSRTKS